jgi:hypothetical protein
VEESLLSAIEMYIDIDIDSDIDDNNNLFNIHNCYTGTIGQVG